jgi:hypothetical protein
VQVREQYATAISKLDQLALAGKEPVTNSAGQTILFTVIYTIFCLIMAAEAENKQLCRLQISNLY